MLFASGLTALLWATFLALGLTALADDKPCTLHHDGNYYDLNPLKVRYVNP
jgi:cation-dependent mannose-6-phosphate receptor